MWSFASPVDSFFALASVLGLLTLIPGISATVQGIGPRDVTPYWGMVPFSGIVLTGLGSWISTSAGIWTLAARSAFILLWVGFTAVSPLPVVPRLLSSVRRRR